MPKFRAFIRGVNFHVHLSDSDIVKPHGFYVNAFIEAESPQKAELEAIELIESPRNFAAQSIIRQMIRPECS